MGTKGGIQKRGQEGIVNRFWKRMQDVVRKAMEEQKQQQQQQQLAGDVQRDHILTGSNNATTKQQNKLNKAEVEVESFDQQNYQNAKDTSLQNKPDNNSIIDADYWDSNIDNNSVIGPVFSDTQSDNISVTDGEIDHSDQDLQAIALKLEKLKKLKAKGIITEENYKVKEKELLDEIL